MQNASPYTSTYEYEFDSEGYITKMVVTERFDDGRVATHTDIVTWE
jgi:hypothetical protein